MTVDSPKQINSAPKITSKIPPVVVAAINLKTIINEKQNINEIVSASVVCCNMVKVVYGPFFSVKFSYHHFGFIMYRMLAYRASNELESIDLYVCVCMTENKNICVIWLTVNMLVKFEYSRHSLQ